MQGSKWILEGQIAALDVGQRHAPTVAVESAAIMMWCIARRNIY